ncbi:MAG: hypothetical protein ABIY55_34890 [Kofleriaceae bacterium]
MRSAVARFGFVVGSLLATGCAFRTQSGAPADAAPVADACTTFSSQVDTCALSLTMDLALTGTVTYDTSVHVLTVDGVAIPVTSQTLATKASDMDALLVHDLHLTAGTTVRATGTLPFAIVASGSVTIDADTMIDVGAGGAGARTSCDGLATAGAPNIEGAGGGGGGGFGASGGDGGQGNSDRGQPADGGQKSLAVAAMPPGPLGGCPGASGGKGDVVGGAGGLAGGALYVVAATSITLGAHATLTAGGGGGGGGGHGNSLGDDGGGGGGSGGLIIIEAPQLVATEGVIVANGGGGGEGSSEESGGAPGTSGARSTSRAAGGAGGSANGADGGLGGSSLVAEGAIGLGAKPGGGGGGGGGIGFVHVVSADPRIGVVSPSPQ